jgi:hypothetical protein
VGYGWTAAPGQDLAQLFAAGTGMLKLVRDERDQLEEQADAVWAGAGGNASAPEARTCTTPTRRT